MPSVYHCVISTGLISCCVFISGCSSLSEFTPSIIRQKRDQVLIKGMISTDGINGGKPLTEFINLHEYALLSANIYDEDKTANPADKLQKRIDTITGSGWKRRPELEITPMQPSWSWKVGDLRYQVWKNRMGKTRFFLPWFFAEPTGTNSETGLPISDGEPVCCPVRGINTIRPAV